MKKKIFFILIGLMLLIIQVGLVSAGYIIQYYSKKKMGMMRYLVYKNRDFESNLFNSNLMIIYRLLLILLLILSVVLICKYFRKGVLLILLNLMLCFISLVGLVLMIKFSTSEFLGYYFVLIAIMGSAVLQLIKLILYCFCTCR